MKTITIKDGRMTIKIEVDNGSKIELEERVDTVGELKLKEAYESMVKKPRKRRTKAEMEAARNVNSGEI